MLAAGALLLAVGIAIGPPGVTVAFPPLDGSFETNAAQFNPADGNLWIGAGIVCAVAALVRWMVRLTAVAPRA